MCFEVHRKDEKTRWKALVVFGDQNEAKVIAYPPTASAFFLEYPEKKLVSDQSKRRVARKTDMDQLIEHVVRTTNTRMRPMTLLVAPDKGNGHDSGVAGAASIHRQGTGMCDSQGATRCILRTG